MKYPVGTKFMSGGKHPRLCTVTDFLTTTNLKGEVVSTRYVATHRFMGQTIVDANVNDVAIAKGLDAAKEFLKNA